MYKATLFFMGRMRYTLTVAVENFDERMLIANELAELLDDEAAGFICLGVLTE